MKILFDESMGLWSHGGWHLDGFRTLANRGTIHQRYPHIVVRDEQPRHSKPSSRSE